MRIYTSCAGCGQLLVWLSNQPHHRVCYSCPTPETYEDTLRRQFLIAAEAGDNAEADRYGALLDSLGKQPPRLLDAALVYASWGWPVFPLKPGSKHPATRHGFKDATTDETVIHGWWRTTPHANIGVPTGVLFDVVDVDTPAGTVTWQQIRDTVVGAAHGLALTAGSGLHVLLPPSGDGNLAGSLPGIDYRGAGGYIVAAPSQLDDGRSYSWIAKPSPMVKTADAGGVVAA